MDTNSITFLLAEDDPDHAELIIYNLEKIDSVKQVEHVPNGEELLKYIKKEAPYENKSQPNAILLDLNMPKLNGLEALEKIKADERFSAIPVIMLTTSNAETDRAKAYAHHANSYLVKPVDFQELDQMLQDLTQYWGKWNKLVTPSAAS